MWIETERRGQTLLIRMTREHKRNAVDHDLAVALDDALNLLDDDPGLRVGVLTGTPMVFCAGTDILDPREKVTERGGEYGVIRRRRQKVLIAAVEGLAVGGGFEIVLSCDLVVASSTARFGLPETRRGLVATSGALFRAPRSLPINVANELLLTGRMLEPERAYHLGLVNTVTEAGGAVDAALALAEEVIQSSPVAIATTLHAVRAMVTQQDDLGWQVTAEARATVVASEDSREGVLAFSEKRPPNWTGR